MVVVTVNDYGLSLSKQKAFFLKMNTWASTDSAHLERVSSLDTAFVQTQDPLGPGWSFLLKYPNSIHFQ